MGNAKILGCVGRLATVLVIIGLLCGCGSDVGSNYDNRELEDCEWRRIPLWRPYDLVDRGGATVEDWDDRRAQDKWWNDLIRIKKVPAHRDGGIELGWKNGRLIRKQYLENISRFCLKPGLIFGEMTISEISETESTQLTNVYYTGYFLFSSNMTHGIQFLSKERYLEKCHEYGVDGNDLKNFDENYKAYWEEHKPKASQPKTDTWIDRFVLVAVPSVIVLFYVAGVVNMIRRPRKKMVCNRDGTGAIPDNGENAVCRQRQIGFLKAVGMCFTRWTFKGRSSRSEFWWPTLVFAGVIYIPRIGLILALLMVIPLFLVEVRRLHDTGRSGWILWAFLVPWAAPLLFGYLGMLFFCPAMTLLAIVVFCIEASPSQPEENQYGPVPNIEEAPL